MKLPTLELADIIRLYKSEFIKVHSPHASALKVLDALEKCRTAALGGHVDVCDSCSHLRISYNSCRNRHCPKCQSTNRERWIHARTQDLLPCSYFHVVFTLPEQINPFCIHYPGAVYDILFTASKDTVEAFSKDPKYLGAQPGMISLLHTWGQNLTLHPHVHMIVPGGGITASGKWKKARNQGKFLFPVKAMSVVFRGKFMQGLLRLLAAKKQPLDKMIRNKLYEKPWVVYAKRPFLGPDQVIEYLGRYTHKIAISNHRIKAIEKGKVTFSYKDYRKGGKQSEMTLEASEFLRRFCLHILPKGFRKIRHYGFLATRNKQKLRLQQFCLGVLKQAKGKPNWKEISLEKLGFDVDACPCCTGGKMIRMQSFAAHAPPELINNLIQQHTLNRQNLLS